MMFLRFRREIILVACMFPADVRHKSASWFVAHDLRPRPQTRRLPAVLNA